MPETTSSSVSATIAQNCSGDAQEYNRDILLDPENYSDESCVLFDDRIHSPSARHCWKDSRLKTSGNLMRSGPSPCRFAEKGQLRIG